MRGTEYCELLRYKPPKGGDCVERIIFVWLLNAITKLVLAVAELIRAIAELIRLFKA